METQLAANTDANQLSIGRYIRLSAVFGLLCCTLASCEIGYCGGSGWLLTCFSVIFFIGELIVWFIPGHRLSVYDNPLPRLLIVFGICAVSSLSIFWFSFSRLFNSNQLIFYILKWKYLFIAVNLFGTSLLFWQWGRGIKFYKVYLSWLLPMFVPIMIIIHVSLPIYYSDSLFSFSPIMEVVCYLVACGACFAVLNESEEIWHSLKYLKPDTGK